MVIPEGVRSPISEAEYIRDFLNKPVVDLVKTSTPENKARLERFNQRNTPEAISQLGREFFQRVDLDHPTLERVRKLVKKGRYADALDAFKQPFFNALAPLADWNSGEGTSIYQHYSWVTEADTLATCRSRDLRNGLSADRDELTVKRFIPGLLPPAKLDFPLQTRPLLLNYVVTKKIEDLRLWEAMTDDWSMGFQDAADKDPEKLRNYFVLLHGGIMGILKDFYMADREAPEFTQNLSGATLARFLMPIIEEIPVANWRVIRTCIFNHTFNGVPEGIFVSGMLDQFYAGQRWQQEMQQGFQRLYTMNQYRDGPMVEIGDEGHFLSTVVSPANLYGYFVHRNSPEWFTPALETYFLDNYRANILSDSRNVSPCGTHVRWNAKSDDLLYLDNELGTKEPYWRNVTDMRMTWGDYYTELTLPVLKEPLPRAIVDTVYGRGRKFTSRHKLSQQEKVSEVYGGNYQGKPEMVSDWLPYAGLWYFRGGWDRNDSFLHMVAPSSPHMHSNAMDPLTGSYSPMHETFGTSSYRFYDYATPLLTCNALWIDDLPACPQEDLVPCGSKQGNFTRAVEKPQSGRWHTGDYIDFGEAIYQGNYRVAKMDFDHKKRVHFENIGERKVENVKTTRQIFQVRPARLFLQIDRVIYSDSAEHTNLIKNVMILTEPAKETGKRLSGDQLRVYPDDHRIKLSNPGNAGAAVAWFGQPDLKVACSGRKIDRLESSQLKGPSETLNGKRGTVGQDVDTIWKGCGESVLISMLRGLRPGQAPIRSMNDISTKGIAGMHAIMTNGVSVTLMVARKIPADLDADSISVNGEALLKIDMPDQGSRVLVLGAKSLKVNKRRVDLIGEDLTFTLESGKGVDSALSFTPIRRPLDPPSFGPAESCFCDSTIISITSASPDVPLEYIAEPMDSSASDRKPQGMKMASINATEWQRYTGPFRISESTFVRARTRRKGVNNDPFCATGTELSAISYAFFFKESVRPAEGWRIFKRYRPGLNYDYLEGRWFALWSNTDQIEAESSGTIDHLFDVSMRQTDGPFAVRYKGYIDIPAEGIYTFYAPEDYMNNSCEPGYDLRLFIDGEEWAPGQMWHGYGQWSIPLAKGAHKFRVTFADARVRDIENQRVDLAFSYPRPTTTWRGKTPVLEVSGPELKRQPVPTKWLKR